MPVVGHGEVRRLLEQELPAATLLRGPQSVGKWTLALHLAAHHRVNPVDQMVIADRLNVASARAAVGFVNVAPFGRFKLVTANLDGASESAFAALLKVLEEPPITARFLLVASRPVPATLLSRVYCHTLGLLTDEQVREVLVRRGMTGRAATSAASLACGQINAALRMPAQAAQRTLVLDLMSAVATHNQERFETAVAGWDDEARDLLLRWVVEALTHEWALYSGDEFFGLDRRPALLRQILLRLSQVPAAQSRLAVRVALEPFLAPF